MKKIFTFCFTLLLTMFASATDFVSNGSGAWTTATTWTPNGTPGIDDKVTIDVGHTVTLSSSTTIGYLVIRGGGILTLTGSPTLRFEGDGNNLPGTNEGGIDMLDGSVLNAGAATIQFNQLFFFEKTTGSGAIFNRGTSTLEYFGETGALGASIIRNEGSFGGGTAGHTLALYNLTINPATINAAPNNYASLSASSAAPIFEIYGVLTVIDGIFSPINSLIPFGGGLTLKATSSTDYARVALNDGAAIASRTTYAGTIENAFTMENTLGTTLQTSTPSGGFYQGDWFQLSYPLQTADLSSGWSGITLNTTGVASTQNIWSWDATSSGNTQVGADFPDANGWTPAVNAEPNWDDKAYTVFLSSDAPFAASQTWSLTGTADLSDVTYDALIHNTADPNGPVATTIATDPAGWVLLRNPWPSNIDTDSWFTSLSGGGVDDGSWGLEYIAVHVYNTIAGQYEGWTTSDITPISSVDYNTAGGVADRATSATQNIPPFQAFWVKTSSASAGTLTLKKKFSTTAISSKVFQKTSSTLPETAVLMSYDEDSLRDITLVYYDNNKTNQFDMRGDIYKRMSDNPGWPNLYIEEAGNKAQSAGRPFKAVDTVEVYYESPKNNTMAHLWLNDTNIAAAYSIMLFDKLTQQTQNMRTNPSYSFTHNVNNNANRFQLILTNNSIGIEESDLDENPINIYATQDELVIESESYTGAAFITLYDMAGRRVMSRKIEVTEGVKMRTQLPTGMANALYTVEIEFDGRVVVEKIMR